MSVELEGVEFAAEASFLVGSLSVHADVKLASLWTVSSSWPGWALVVPGLFLNLYIWACMDQMKSNAIHTYDELYVNDWQAL